MKIIFSNYDDLKNPYYGGGGAVAVHEVAQRLAKKNQVTVITGNYPGAVNKVIDGVQYLRVGSAFWGPKFGQLIFQVSLLPVALTDNYDIWIENFTPPFSASLLPLFTKKPVIGLVHMLAAEDMTRKYNLPIFSFVENLGLKLYKYFITPSEVVCQKIKSINPRGKISVIPNGVSLPKVSTRKKIRKYVLFLGRIEINQKGLDLLLTAYSRIKHQIHYPLYIAGTGEKTEMIKLNKLISDLGITHQVRLLGKIQGDERNQMYRNALLTVISSRYETFPMVALESMASGTGIISFNIDALKWIPSGLTVKVPCFNTSKLASEILSLSTHHASLSRMGKFGEEFARKFTWGRTYYKYSRFISDVINKNNYE